MNKPEIKGSEQMIVADEKMPGRHLQEDSPQPIKNMGAGVGAKHPGGGLGIENLKKKRK